MDGDDRTSERPSLVMAKASSFLPEGELSRSWTSSVKAQPHLKQYLLILKSLNSDNLQRRLKESMKALSSFCPSEHMPLKGRWTIKTKSFRACARKRKQSRWMTVKRLRPVYRLARRPIINGLKIKTISLNSYTNIKSSVDETRGFLP